MFHATIVSVEHIMYHRTVGL